MGGGPLVGFGGLGGLGGALGVSPSSGGAVILGYNSLTGTVSGTAAPGALVVVTVGGTYAASVMASTSGTWSAVLANAGGKLLSAGVVPLGYLIAGSSPTPIISTLDPTFTGASYVLSNGNLTAMSTSSSPAITRSITSRSTGKFYFEATQLQGNNFNVGVCNANQGANSAISLGNSVQGISNNSYSGIIGTSGGSGTQNGASQPAGTVWGIYIDFDSGSMGVYQNGKNLGGAALPSGSLYAFMYNENSVSYSGTMNFGATSFAYPPSIGFSAWS